MPTYTIQCFIEMLSSDNKITLRGSDGYRLLKEEKSSDNTKIQKKYLIFFEDSSDEINCRLVCESDEFTIQKPAAKIQEMLLMAHVNRKKVELKCNLQNGNKNIKVTKVKLLQ